MSISFTKLHGNGNDFALIDEMAGVVIPDDMKAGFALHTVTDALESELTVFFS